MSRNNIFRSSYPEVPVPAIDVPSFVLHSPDFAARGDQPAYIDAVTGETISFRGLRLRAEAFAAGLQRTLAMPKWGVVAVYSPNTIHYPMLVFGTLIAGCTISGANPTYTADELAYQLSDSGASVLVVAAEFVANGRAAARKAGLDEKRIFVLAPQAVDGLESVFTLLRSDGPLRPVKFTADELANRAAYLCYSSGTTGRSKGVMTTHRNIVANIAQVLAIFKVAPDSTWIGVLPFYHIYGLVISLHCAPFKGVPVVVMPKFDLERLLSAIERYKITEMFIVPPIILALAKAPIVSKYNLKSLRALVSGAAPLGSELADEAAKRLNVIVTQAYGLTETSPLLHGCPYDKVVSGSIGVLAPNVEARLVNPDTEKDCGHNEPGELWVRGPNIMKGYHNNKKATDESIDTEGFFHTGDIAVVNENGYFFIVDRLKELIKYKGLQVPPAELEAKLLANPKIADAAVIGTPDERAGELPLAYVVLQPGVKLTEKEIQEYIAKQVAPHKQLRGGVVFIDAIPKAASGKILRRQLRLDDAERRKKAGAKAKL
ncbi:hypothetical protein HK105_204408 [Polyrhizophydium stewartii]|uniref:Acetyl-CoA synthetase-like protein n=2 Tax=Polyrhizophydium stewartii TaxID=2732419 RepID=A0ABR4N8Z4_9FUNG